MVYETEFGFEEQVGRLAQAADSVRYGDGVTYQHEEKANALDPLMEQLGAKAEEYGDEELEALYEEFEDYFAQFEDIKYNGETESGPEAFIVVVDGSTDVMAEYAREMDGTIAEWEKKGYDTVDPLESLTAYARQTDGRSVPDQEYRPEADGYFPQLLYETMEHNDGAIIAGEDGFLPAMYEIPQVDLPDAAYPAGAGTKHRAAVNAVNAPLDVEVRSIVLSAETGAVRVFRENADDLSWPFDRGTPNRIGNFWQEVRQQEAVPDGGEDACHVITAGSPQ